MPTKPTPVMEQPATYTLNQVSGAFVLGAMLGMLASSIAVLSAVG